MVLQCLHFDISNATNNCNRSYEECAKRVDCQHDEHCFGVFNESAIIKAGCNPQFPTDSERCDSECTGKPRGRVHYCCCTRNNCNAKMILPPPLPPQQPTSRTPPPLPPSSPTIHTPWLLILVILMLITVILGSFVKRKSLKRAGRSLMSHVEAGGLGASQDRNHHSQHLGSKSNTNNNNHNTNNNHPHQNNNIGNSNNTNTRELNEMRITKDVAIIIPFQVTTKNTDINSSSTSQPQQADAKGNISSAPVQQYYTKIDLKDIKLLEIVGSGRFGRVHKASIERTSPEDHNINNESNTAPTSPTTDATNNTKEAGDNDDHANSNHHDQDKIVNGNADTKINFSEIAVKVIHASEHQSWQNELKIYSFPKTRHENISRFLGSCQHVESDSYWLLVEYAPRGSLHHYLKENTVSWNELLNISLGVVRGLSHLHDADIAHRDFKSKNVLLKQDLTPCITDFGVASMLDNSSGSQPEQRKKYLQVGTPRYMAPEVLECSVTFTKTSFTKIDVYALSLVLWEIMYRCWPLPRLLHYDGDDSLIMNGNYVQMPPPPPPPPPPQSSGQDDNSMDEQTNLLAGGNTDRASQEPPDYMMPFENVVGPNPDINTMRQVVICDKHRPPIKHEWYYFPVSKFCQAIIDGWEYDHDARISASCFVERIEGLQQQQLQDQHQQLPPQPPQPSPPPPPTTTTTTSTTTHSSSPPLPAPVPEQFQSQELQSQCPS